MGGIFLRCRWLHLTRLARVSGNSELATHARRSAFAGPQLPRGRKDRGTRRSRDAFLRLLAHSISRGPAHRRKTGCSESSSGYGYRRIAAVIGTLLPRTRNLCSASLSLRITVREVG